jgi:heterodisulfide reductase subunit A-like polyferredoxin
MFLSQSYHDINTEIWRGLASKSKFIHTMQDNVPTSAPKRIAIIGSGISGLATAFILTKAGHHVELFEKENEIGMDAHGVSGISNCDPETRVSCLLSPTIKY